jgi:hypothetical protein
MWITIKSKYHYSTHSTNYQGISKERGEDGVERKEGWKRRGSERGKREEGQEV